MAWEARNRPFHPSQATQLKPLQARPSRTCTHPRTIFADSAPDKPFISALSACSSASHTGLTCLAAILVHITPTRATSPTTPEHTGHPRSQLTLQTRNTRHEPKRSGPAQNLSSLSVQSFIVEQINMRKYFSNFMHPFRFQYISICLSL